MLLRKNEFDTLEKELRKTGKIREFERKYGKILGRVLIDIGELPSDMEEDVLKDRKKEELFIFNCSFDFYDAALGIALERKTLKVASGMWITEQIDEAELPSEDWINFFVRMLSENVINSPNGFGVPIYIFVNNNSEMVVVPSKKE